MRGPEAERGRLFIEAGGGVPSEDTLVRSGLVHCCCQADSEETRAKAEVVYFTTRRHLAMANGVDPHTSPFLFYSK